MTRPEQRWLNSELPDELRRVLQSAELDDPDAARVARLRARLGVALGPAFASPPAGPRAAASPRAFQFLSLGKAIGLVSAMALGFGTAWWGSQTPLSPPPSAAEPALLPARVAAQPEPLPSPPPPAAAPPAPAQDKPAPAQDKPAPAQDKPAHRERARAPGLGEELRQLESIRGWLARSPQRALAAADEHERRFPNGALAPERELLRIDALLRLGQLERARVRAERVLAAPEGHSYRAQVASLLSGYRGPAAAKTITPTREE